MDKAMQRRHKIRDKSFFFVWMACLLFTLFFIGYFFFLRTSEVDVTQHVVLEYSGESGSASVAVRSEEILKESSQQAVAMMKKAENTIEQERKKAMNELKDEVASLSVMIASKVVERDVKEADHERFIEEFIDKVG